jgi:RNA polymerase sigma factor (sigma-70 family)
MATNLRDEQLKGILACLLEKPRDEKAWSALYQLMRPLVLATTYRNLRGHLQLAEDATQEVFLRLVRFGPFEKIQDPEIFRRYLYIVSRNISRSYLERILKDAAREAEVTTQSRTETSSTVREEAEANELVDCMLRSLDAPDRRVLKLLLHGYSLKEIGESVGSSYSAIGTRLHRLRAQLREFLDAFETGSSKE